MEIKVLGTGCAGCKALHETVKQAVAELEIEATVIKIEDLMEIMNYNVLAMPGLVIDEKVVSAGKKLSLSDVKKILTKE
ncbi:MAG: thioredoxin family protein [Phocaeicola sp.]